MSRLVTCIGLALLLSSAFARRAPDPSPTAINIYQDPAEDQNNPLKYIASNVLTSIAFALILLVAFTHTFNTFRYGTKFMLAMTIGAYTYAVGIGMRYGLHVKPDSEGIYIVEYMFIVLSPCAFIAADYVLLSRLSRHLGCDKYLLVRPTRITFTFISSDITTFLIQAGGGGLSVSAKTYQAALTGSRVFLAGLAIQLASFSTFTAIYVLFLYRVHKHRPDIWTKDQGLRWYNDWRALASALCISCTGILIRSIYRVIELSQGFEGPLTINEPLFYGLDTLPLYLSIFVYVFFWPGRFILKVIGEVEGADPTTSVVSAAPESVEEKPELEVTGV